MFAGLETWSAGTLSKVVKLPMSPMLLSPEETAEHCAVHPFVLNRAASPGCLLLRMTNV